MTKTLNIVFQTHWDREWYYSFEYYRHRLTQVIERVVSALENHEIEYFVLDGQVAALEDYYEVADDEMIQKVQKLVQEKRIIIGPWYVLSDEFLVNGESLIRNLEIGMKIANQEGNCQKIGYLPDTFGHVSQIPQILQGFNIKDAIIWRGINTKESELIWEGMDGTQVFTLFLADGYYQAIVDQPEYKKLMQTFINKIEKCALTDELLLTNGGDHLAPAKVDISKRIDTLEEAFQDVNFKVTNYEDYIHAVKSKLNLNELSIQKGEFRENQIIQVLPNVLSTRSYLKVENQLLEDQILGYTEPLIALTYNPDDMEPKRYLEESWKLLMQNHPHDSICGCSIDEVHHEMQIRSMKLKQRLDMLEKGALQQNGLYDAHLHTGNKLIFADLRKFLIFNPHPFTYTGEVKLTVYMREDQETLLSGFNLKDQNGNIYVPTILNRYNKRSFESPLDYSPEFRKEVFFDILIQVENFEAMSLKEFELVEGKYEEQKQVQVNSIENELIKLEVINNQVNLIDKVNNKTYEDVNHFYSSLDQGDEYNYSKPLHDVKTDQYEIQNVTIKQSTAGQFLTYQVNLLLPEGLNESRNGASEKMVTTQLAVEMMIGSTDEVKVKVKVDNQARDQRLRTTFNTHALLQASYSDSAFSVEKRSIRDEIFESERGYGKEVPVVVDPSQSLIYASNDEAGIVLTHRGLHEYQMVNKDDKTHIELTLIRSVGWLSRDDFRSRGAGAGPGFETPGGQCIGEYTFDYSFAPVNPKLSIGAYLNRAHFNRVPLKLYKGKLKGENKSLISLDNVNIQWSSIRKVGKNIYLRLWNPLDTEQIFHLNSSYNFKSIEKVQLNHDIIEEIDVAKVIKMKAFEIMTICIGV